MEVFTSLFFPKIHGNCIQNKLYTGDFGTREAGLNICKWVYIRSGGNKLVGVVYYGGGFCDLQTGLWIIDETQNRGWPDFLAWRNFRSEKFYRVQKFWVRTTYWGMNWISSSSCILLTG